MNTYIVDKELDINQVEAKLNERASAGYKVVEVIPTGAGNIAIVFVKTVGGAQQSYGGSD